MPITKDSVTQHISDLNGTRCVRCGVILADSRWGVATDVYESDDGKIWTTIKPLASGPISLCKFRY